MKYDVTFRSSCESTKRGSQTRQFANRHDSTSRVAVDQALRSTGFLQDEVKQQLWDKRAREGKGRVEGKGLREERERPRERSKAKGFTFDLRYKDLIQDLT